MYNIVTYIFLKFCRKQAGMDLLESAMSLKMGNIFDKLSAGKHFFFISSEFCSPLEPFGKLCN